MRSCHRQLVFIAAILLGPVPALAQGVPKLELTCAQTKIASVEHRLQSGANGPFVAGSGSAVRFANGAYQVSYDEIEAVQHSRDGDRVFMCLIRIPRNCPPGDNRGRVYTTTNLRTMDSWTLPDSEHACGGA